MVEMRGTLDLLEDLKKSVGCEYISDLRFAPFNCIAREKIAFMKLEDYPAPMLCDAANYLYGVNVDFSSAEHAKKFFMAGKSE